MMVSGGGGTAAHASFHSHVVTEFDEPDRTSHILKAVPPAAQPEPTWLVGRAGYLRPSTPVA